MEEGNKWGGKKSQSNQVSDKQVSEVQCVRRERDRLCVCDTVMYSTVKCLKYLMMISQTSFFFFFFYLFIFTFFFLTLDCCLCKWHAVLWMSHLIYFYGTANNGSCGAAHHKCKRGWNINTENQVGRKHTSCTIIHHMLSKWLTDV